MRRAAILASAVVAAGALALAGCTAPYDDDGEAASGRLAPAVAVSDDARRVVVDTDLGGDDLVALAFLLRRPDVRVEAVTVAATGLVGCDAGPDLVADLVAALDVQPVPVGCGRASAGAGGRALPQDWRERAAAGPGLRDAAGPARPAGDAVGLLARAARAARSSGRLTVVALGPATNLADLAAERPAAYARLDAVHLMAGAVESPAVDGVVEWNAAADPAALRAVLAAGGPPVTVVPDDAVPDGTPAVVLDAPVVGGLAAVAGLPRWWDLATAAALVAPDAVEETDVEAGSWTVDDVGRLERTGPGAVRVVRALDEAALEAAYAEAFAAGADR
ncbi:nucleoside hydrolase [Nocardioides abyssi]|uniref:Nucleoside hydrolase n=1 Tax=Nocardioides abyssi TaxID=3058370 RepID=A0ABT8EZ28_9ACTN|nr:nucleoside hydrolase [Nocardioides abyssi]MDN4163412.1 nucleoside hydrolase [Nocardioides abyssi]